MSQQRARAVPVVDRNGMRGTLDAASPEFKSGRGQVLVHLENGEQAFVPADELRLQNDGTFTLPFSFSELMQLAATDRSGAGGQHMSSRGREDENETVVVPVIAEKLDVQKRKVDSGGVRIRKIVHEREEVIDEPLIREEVQVKRVPVNRVVEGPIPVRHVGNTMIVSLLEEVLVVEKRLMLKEELHITKGEIETYKPQRITLRTEEAMVERVESPNERRDNSNERRDNSTGEINNSLENPPKR